jgi:hypothetical protein
MMGRCIANLKKILGTAGEMLLLSMEVPGVPLKELSYICTLEVSYGTQIFFKRFILNQGQDKESRPTDIVQHSMFSIFTVVRSVLIKFRKNSRSRWIECR